jgi:hypothetical protein
VVIEDDNEDDQHSERAKENAESFEPISNLTSLTQVPCKGSSALQAHVKLLSNLFLDIQNKNDSKVDSKLEDLQQANLS